jgi:hypothetical protein
MSVSAWLGRLLGIDHLDAIEPIKPSLAAPWAQDRPLFVLLGCIVLAVLGAIFYSRFQPERRRGVRIFLAVSRAALLCLILLFLAEPTLVVRIVSHPRPLLWLLFDGTDSMAIEDDLSELEREKLESALDLPKTEPDEASQQRRSRIDYVQALVNQKDGNVLKQLEEKFRLRAFLFDRTDGVQSLKLNGGEGQPIDPALVAGQLTTKGQVTALGSALANLAQGHGTSNLAGLVVVSDFDENSGMSSLAAARQLGVPVYCVGVGPAAAVDLGIQLDAPLVMKKAEKSLLKATLTQNGLEGRSVTVRLLSRLLGDSSSDGKGTLVSERTVALAGSSQLIEFPFIPGNTGRYVFTAEVDPQEGEVVRQNNQAEREVNIRDDYFRLMFVEYEPTWEWRFIKEVFHRDPLVGMRGFRTFLRSADPKVRQTNELFLATLTPQRSEFFANDVIFLGDMPASTLSTRFCEQVKEFVDTFGGGLVVLAGPNFGPGQLAGTPLADMLPVVVDPDARVRDARDFTPRLTSVAQTEAFMQLKSTETENRKAWSNMGRLPWYQPVSKIAQLGTVLMEHPTDTCNDGKTPQPLIATRRYGNGWVVYLGFNETWRLRRKYGELYFRQFWGQMILKLATNHDIGNQKRFVVRTDKQNYQADDKVFLSVDAYDENFKPLAADKLAEHRLTGELILPGHSTGQAAASANPLPVADGHEPLSIPQLREGRFETAIPVLVAGEHRVKVKDPITNEFVEVNFQVTSVSAERRSAVRNVEVQTQLATISDGKSYDLATVHRLPDEIKQVSKTEATIRVFSIWNNWLAFGLVVGLMLIEWLVRKWVNLP